MRRAYSDASSLPPSPAASASPSARALAHDRGFLLDPGLLLDLKARRRERRDHRLRVVDERDRPGGPDRVEGEGVADLHLGDVVLKRVGNVRRKRLDGELSRDLLEHATFLRAGRIVDADQFEHDSRLNRLVEPHPQQVDVHRVSVDRVPNQILDDDGRRRTVDAQIEHCACVGQCKPQLTGADRERNRVLAAAVNDPGHLAFATQAPGGARAGGLPYRDRKGCCI